MTAVRVSAVAMLLASPALAGCRPPLPPLQTVWRETPDDPARRTPPPAVQWRPEAAWATVRRAQLRNGLAVYGVTREWPLVGLTLASPGASLRDDEVSREELAVATRALRTALERTGRPGHPRLDVTVDASDEGSVVTLRAASGDLPFAASSLRAALRGDALADRQVLNLRDEVARERHDRVGSVELMQIALRQQIYGEESPAARPADGYSDRIAATQLPGIRRALGAFLTVGSSLILSGEFAFEESVAQLDAALGDAPLGPATPLLPLRRVGVAPAQEVLVMPTVGRARSLLVLACPLGTSDAEGAAAQEAFASLLGGDLASSFAELIRGDQALSYVFDVRVRRVGGQATLFAMTSVEVSRAGEVLDRMMEHFDDLARRGLSDAAAAQALMRLRFDRVAEWDSPWGVGPSLARSLLRGEGAGPPGAAPDERAAVRREVRELAGVCSASRLQIALAGDARVLLDVGALSGRPPPRVRWRQEPTLDP